MPSHLTDQLIGTMKPLKYYKFYKISHGKLLEFSDQDQETLLEKSKRLLVGKKKKIAKRAQKTPNFKPQRSRQAAKKTGKVRKPKKPHKKVRQVGKRLRQKKGRGEMSKVRSSKKKRRSKSLLWQKAHRDSLVFGKS